MNILTNRLSQLNIEPRLNLNLRISIYTFSIFSNIDYKYNALFLQVRFSTDENIHQILIDMFVKRTFAIRFRYLLMNEVALQPAFKLTKSISQSQ